VDLRTDYLVVGAGAVGMAFADAIVTHSNADVVLVDRRHRPGGHWNDAYPFLRLHAPSANYGVNSTALGNDAIDTHGPNAGRYELATGAAIVDYYTRVLDERLIPSGRVRFLGGHDYHLEGPGHRLTSHLTGATADVTVGRAIVDARYLRNEVPASHTPDFHVGPGVRLVPVGGLAALAEPGSAYTIIGAGKTAMDACLWLLGNGVDPDRIRWIKSREAWLLNRSHLQPLELVASLVEGQSLDIAALAAATSLDDFFLRLEASERLLRVDPDVTPTMYHCATVTRSELADLRRIRDVVRLGRVRHIGVDQVTLDDGTIPGGAGHVYVDCSAIGLSRAPARPVFEPGRITVQTVRTCQPCFSAALIGYLEATRDDLEDKNRLTPPNPTPDVPRDYLRGFAANLVVMAAWSAVPDVAAWIERSRLNMSKGIPDHREEPLMREAMGRLRQFGEPARNRLAELLG
jgi:putative NAD(P)-binding protein